VNARGGDVQAIEVRRRLVDPGEVCSRLGIDEGARRQARGLLIRCPWHADRIPSCSVRQAEDETIAVKCFGCGATGDVFDLVAAGNGLDARRNFPRVLELAMDLAGVSSTQAPPPAQRMARPSNRGFPPIGEVATLWDSCRPVFDDPEVSAWLRSRALDPGDVEDFGVARALPRDLTLPAWARLRGRGWTEGGYRCLLPMFDERGVLRSVRARQIGDGAAPKAVPPAGFSLSGLVMADALSRQLLAGAAVPDVWPASTPLRIVVAEGEPDYLTWATAFSDADVAAPAVFGVVAGSWTKELAARVPDHARIIVRTHHDEAGERYAREVFATFGGRRVALVRGGVRDCAACATALRGAA